MTISVPLQLSRIWLRSVKQGISRISRLSRYNYTSSSYPITPTCPLPTCECQQMPEGLDIDYKRTLNGTVAPYSDHLLIHTGTYDWPSNVDNDSRHPLAHEMRTALRKKIIESPPGAGPNILINNSSFPVQTAEEPPTYMVSLMKSGLHVQMQRSYAGTFIQSLASQTPISVTENVPIPPTTMIQSNFK